MARTILENIVTQQYKDQTFFSFCEYTNIRFFEILYFEKGISGKSGIVIKYQNGKRSVWAALVSSRKRS